MSILKIKNTTTGEWEEVPAIVGPTGPAGPQGPQGEQGLDGKDGITPHIGDNGNWFIGETDTEMPSQGETVLQEAVLYTPQLLTKEQKAQVIQNVGAVPAPMIATVGQTVMVKAVDENGVPTEWEVADLPTGGEREWELYDTITVSEDIGTFTIGNLTDATSLYAKGYKELYIVYSLNPHATTPMTDLRIQVNSVSGGAYASFPNYAPAAGKTSYGFLYISTMPIVRHSVILAHQKGPYAAAGIIKTAEYDDRAIGLYDKISVVAFVSFVGAGSTFTIYGR